jgi:tetratricopeptide (TPR) repeat protein
MSAGAAQDLTLLLTGLQEQQKTGTLKLCGPDGQVKYLYVRRGTIELLKTTRTVTLLGKALLKQRKLTHEQLKAAVERQKAAPTKLRLGEILIGMEIVRDEDVAKALAFQVAEEIFDCFSWSKVKSDFIRGDPPLDIFENEDLQARVSLSPIQLTREAIRRQNEITELRRLLPSTQDVPALTPQAQQKQQDPNPAIHEVLACVDGESAIQELLDVVRAPDLVALRVLARMMQEGDVVALSAQDLLTLGQSLEDRAEFERAKHRYLRAEELGHPDFDLPRRIGQIAEALGDVPEASKRYVVYADKCVTAGYPDVAALTLARVLELDPAHVEALERHTELLVKAARKAAEDGDPEAGRKAAEASAQLERLLERAERPEDQRRILGELLSLVPSRHDLRERLARVALQLGDTADAVLDLQELAVSALEAGQLDRAVSLLRQILELDPNDVLAQQSLAATSARMGKTEDAVREYLRLAQSLEASGLASASGDRMVDIYEKVLELDGGNDEARRFLAKAYEGKKEADKAISHWSRIAESHRAKGQKAELLQALDKLLGLKPGDAALGLEKARLLVELGRGADAAALLRGVAEGATKQGDAATAQAAWTELLRHAPGDLDAHLAVARVEAASKESASQAAAARRYAAVFELAVVAGKDELAEEAVKRALDLEPDKPEHRERLARVLVAKGRADEAARTLVRAARRARDDENLGLAQAWTKKALELDGTCDDARDLLEALRRPAPAAAPPLDPFAPREGEAPRQTIAATITGGAKTPSIEGWTTKSPKIRGIADKLSAMKIGGPLPPSEPGPGKAEADAAEAANAKKASAAMNKLRAMKSGGNPAVSGAGESTAAPRPDSAEAGGLPASLAAAAAATESDAPAAPTASGAPGPAKISKGPEAPGEAVDDGLAKKASSAMNKLKVLKSGGPGPAEAKPGDLPARISKGPEAPGEAIDEGVAKKASSAMNRLKAMKSGAPAPLEVSSSEEPPLPGGGAQGGGGVALASDASVVRANVTPSTTAPAAAPPAGGPKISKGPEAPGEAVDQGLAKKASSAMDRLKALKAGTSAPGGGEGKPAAEPAKISKGPEAPGEVADPSLARKASSAMSKLKALKGGLGGAPPPPPPPSDGPAPSSGPDAAPPPPPPAPTTGSGGGPGPSPLGGPKLSKGPEAPGEAIDEGVARKASSAMSKLKALKAGGGGNGAGDGKPAGADAALGAAKISKGPEAPGEVADPSLARKASSAMSRLKALKAGVVGAGGGGGGGASPSATNQTTDLIRQAEAAMREVEDAQSDPGES